MTNKTKILDADDKQKSNSIMQGRRMYVDINEVLNILQ